MALDVTDWNLSPNQRFFVHLQATIAGVFSIDIYNTKADLDAAINRVAFATGAFGTDVAVEVTEDGTPPSSGKAISKFNSDLSYDLKVSGSPGDPEVKLQIGPFTELPPIEDALLVTEQMIAARAALELNRGTHSSFHRELRLDRHYEALNENDIISLSSTKRGLVSEPNRVDELAIEATVNEDGQLDMFDIIEVTVFEDVVR